MQFDEAVAVLGDCGRYQRRVYLLLSLTSLSGCIQLLMSVFTMSVPDHRCALPGVENDTWQVQSPQHAALINVSIPPGKSSPYSSCEIYTYQSANSHASSLTLGYEYRDYDDGGVNATLSSVHSNRTRGTMKCSRYVYDTSIFKTTVVTQMDLVCEKRMSRSHAQTATMIGYLSGSAISSIPSDVFGRKRVMMFAVVLHAATSLSLAWIPYFPLLCVMCWLNGMSVLGLYTNAYVIGVEMVGPSKRVMAGIVIVVFWCLGMIVLTPFAYLIRYWKTLQMTMTFFPIFFFSYFWLVPESARWLLRKGRVQEAEAIIRHAARINGVEKELPAKIFDEHPPDESRNNESVLMLRHHPRLLLKYLMVVFNWFVSSLTFYGLNLNLGNLSGSVYVNFMLSGVMELVSYITCILLLDRLGRRSLNCGLIMLAGITCTATIFPLLYAPPASQWITVALSMIGKLGISGAFAIIWVYTSELFPTVIRNSGMGTCSVCAGMGGVLAPYIANMGSMLGHDAATAIPLVIFGVCSVIAGLLLLLLPETLGERLPETIEDALVLFKITSSSDGEDGQSYNEHELKVSNGVDGQNAEEDSSLVRGFTRDNPEC